MVQIIKQFGVSKYSHPVVQQQTQLTCVDPELGFYKHVYTVWWAVVFDKQVFGDIVRF